MSLLQAYLQNPSTRQCTQPQARRKGLLLDRAGGGDRRVGGSDGNRTAQLPGGQ